MARCMFPYYVERKFYYRQEDGKVPVPCGKCPACLKRRLHSWSFRLEVESLRWPKQFFLTLTYENEHVPISKNGFMTLEPKHVTAFFKRLRSDGHKFVYYMCGEYGTHGKRPHYHVILLTDDYMDEIDIIHQWREVTNDKTFGNVYFGKVEPASIRYTVQYYDKGDWRPVHNRDDRVPEYSRMSKGIGSSFLTPKMVKHILDDPTKAFIYDYDGHKIAIPRYYTRRIFDFVATDRLIAANPSMLVHRDEMAEVQQIRNMSIKDKMEEILRQNPPPEDSKELNEARKMEIINYRRSKRKSRN